MRTSVSTGKTRYLPVVDLVVFRMVDGMTSLSISRLAETRAGVEMTIVWGFAGIRAFDLAQAAVAMSSGSLRTSTAPGVDLAVLSLVLIESLTLCSWLVRRRSVRPLQWPAAADFGVALLVLCSSLIYVAPEDRTNVWVMWSYPVTLSTTVLIGAALTRWQHALVTSVLIAATYAGVVALPLRGAPAGQGTSIANALAYPGFAMVSYLFMSYMRRLADTADSAKAQVAELERDRSRAIVHDLLPYLRLDRFADADLDARLAMVAQAGHAYGHMRSFVDGTQHPLRVRDRIQAVLDLRPRPTVQAAIDLEPSIELPEDVLDHLHRALDTALSNVEQHAPGAAIDVTAHADDTKVVVTVRDNGPGFDMSTTPSGFGIAEILGRQLALVGGVSRIESAPGRGTEVHITVPRKQ
ncbi:ATP-binding protein [Amycolatopsis sp. NPDC024027]|uniref:sensor histidine kinase n=1 Tax=Amycolatopsis sp. NPDC024027 TaxID=3154327 RepID=UPI0033F2D448